jgi:cyclohexanone monooxygenase
MNESTRIENVASAEQSRTVDVVIVGAGFSGMYAIFRLRQIGLTVQCYESAGDVGGVWYWNNYPGARCDGESMAYSYSFDDALQQEWDWPERYSAQPDILRYCQHVAERFNLRPYIAFNTKVTAAHWDEESSRWLFETSTGGRMTAKYFVSAIGCLSATRVPDVPGIGDFKGDSYHTGAWPAEKVDFTGQRVGIIGTGSSAIQAIPIIAQEASQLTVFQRTPNYSVPSRNAPMDKEEEKYIKDNYGHFRYLAKSAGLGFVQPNPNNAFDVSDEERRAEFQKRWDFGGPLFMFSFRDMMVNPAANEAAADFIREKIRETVKDPATADLLSPKGYPIGAKRICVDTNYYETFNQPHVKLVDVKTDPLARITEKGLQLASGRAFEFDRLIFATGYDAMTGSLFKVDIRGRGGLSLQEKWAAGPVTYLGLTSHDFPNMFIVTGPGSPSVISNVLMSLEQHIDWLADTIVMMERKGIATIEADEQYERDWVEHVNEVAYATLFPQADSWYLGPNVPGKRRVFMPYVAGTVAYREKCDAVAANGYEGFILSEPKKASLAAE